MVVKTKKQEDKGTSSLYEIYLRVDRKSYGCAREIKEAQITCGLEELPKKIAAFEARLMHSYPGCNIYAIRIGEALEYLDDRTLMPKEEREKIDGYLSAMLRKSDEELDELTKDFRFLGITRYIGQSYFYASKPLKKLNFPKTQAF